MDRAESPVLLALTFVTGLIDATSFLALGGVFSAMMTGNVVFLGLGLSGSVDSSVLGPLLAIAAFVLASAAAALLARRMSGPLFGHRSSNAVEIGLLAAATCVAAVTLDGGDAGAHATVVLLAAAMGWRTTNVRALRSINLPTAVLNLTMSASSGAGPADAADLVSRSLGLVCLLAGAIVGGLLVQLDPWVPLALAVLVSVLVAGGLSRQTQLT
jgi:uncharacterized membrane protein YoaK (UPF0700 family)